MVPENHTDNLREIYDRNVDMIYHICLIYLKNPADAEDAVHNTFVKLMEKGMTFENEQHERNWLIKVAVNISKNMLRHWSRYTADLEEVTDEYSEVPRHIRTFSKWRNWRLLAFCG